MPELVLSITDIDATINHEPRIADLRLAEALAYGRPREIRDLVERHRDSLERFGSIPRHRAAKIGRGRPEEALFLNRRQALYICTKAETERATEATIEMVEVFDAYLKGALAPKPLAWSDLSTRQKSELVRRANELLDPSYLAQREAIQALLLRQVAAELAAGRLPDIRALSLDLPGLPAAPGRLGEAEFRKALWGWFQAAPHEARPGLGAVYDGERMVFYRADAVTIDGDKIAVAGEWLGNPPDAYAQAPTFAGFAAALEGARGASHAPGIGAVYIGDRLVLFEASEATLDDDGILRVNAKALGDWRRYPTAPTTGEAADG